VRRVALATVLLVAASIAGAQDERPSVLLILADDLNTDIGAYGHPLVVTPHMDRLAERGVRFLRAYSQYPVCNPSRSSFLTGLYPEQTGVLTNADRFRDRLPETPTLPQWFRKHGYFVARVGKVFHYGVPGQIGTSGEDDPASWDEVVNPIGIDKEVEDRIHSLEPGKFGGTLSWLRLDSVDEDHTDGIGATRAIELLEEHHPDRTGRPFFLAVGFYRPHTPFVAPARHFDRYPRAAIQPVWMREGDRDDIPLAALADRPHQLELTDAQRREIIQAYYASISHVDAQVGRLLDALARLKLDGRTIVVLSSDHGYHLGAHGLWQKGDLFEGSARVPLVFARPSEASAGRTADAVVELTDLYPTLVDLCGLPAPGHLVGTSLRPVLDDPTTSVRETALTVAWSRAGWVHEDLRGLHILGRSIRTSRYRYTEWDGGRHGVELYDYEADPDEYTNLAGRLEAADVERELEGLLRERESFLGNDP
jgi:iduronate 2-sulfatase